MQEHAQGRGFQGFSRDLSHPPPEFGAHVHQICMHVHMHMHQICMHVHMHVANTL